MDGIITKLFEIVKQIDEIILAKNENFKQNLSNCFIETSELRELPGHGTLRRSPNFAGRGRASGHNFGTQRPNDLSPDDGRGRQSYFPIHL